MWCSFSCVMLLLHSVLSVPWWRVTDVRAANADGSVQLSQTQFTRTSAAMTSFNQSCAHPLQASLPHSHQDQREIGSSESSQPLSSSGNMWSTERKKECMGFGSVALTHLSAFVLLYLSSRASFCLSFFFVFKSPPPPPPSSPQRVSHLVSIPLRFTPTFSFWLSGPLPLSLSCLKIVSLYHLLWFIFSLTSLRSMCHLSWCVGWTASL